jgi:hypothetical protein
LAEPLGPVTIEACGAEVSASASINTAPSAAGCGRRIEDKSVAVAR